MRVLPMRPRGIQRATNTSQDRNRGPVLRFSLKVLDNHDETVMRADRGTMTRKAPADNFPLAAT